MTNTQLITVVIRGRGIVQVRDDEFRPMLRSLGLVTINLGEDEDIDEWAISDPYTTATVGRAYAK